MSGIEALVVVFGLFIGYWLVAKLLADKPGSGSSASETPREEAARKPPEDA